ncbi:hypothetical protein GCM10010922_03800 [Microbacterium sorbitolivorans]|nr:hypothetical protein GCM10010922_03800 [Microbacterium sorbitolivorans]
MGPPPRIRTAARPSHGRRAAPDRTPKCGYDPNLRKNYPESSAVWAHPRTYGPPRASQPTSNPGWIHKYGNGPKLRKNHPKFSALLGHLRRSGPARARATVGDPRPAGSATAELTPNCG